MGEDQRKATQLDLVSRLPLARHLDHPITMLGSLRRLAQQSLPPASRLQELAKLRSDIFGTTFNPESLRTGSKILKARLRGPAMLAYYGQRFSGFKALNAAIPGLELRDVVEEQRCVSRFPFVPPYPTRH